MTAPVDRTNGKLDAAVLAYRVNPSTANEQALLAAQAEHVDNFFAEQAKKFQEASRGK